MHCDRLIRPLPLATGKILFLLDHNWRIYQKISLGHNSLHFSFRLRQRTIPEKSRKTPFITTAAILLYCYILLLYLHKINLYLTWKPIIIILIESSRFEEENEYVYEIQLKVFAHVLKKITPRQSLILFFFSPNKLVRLFILREVKPSPDSKMIKLLTCDILLPPRHSR